MGSRLMDLTGQKFGKWTVVSFYGMDKSGKHSYWNCICNCKEHTKAIVGNSSLRVGSSKSCGCLQKELLKKKWKPQLLITKTNKKYYLIPLTQGLYSIIDIEDYEKIRDYSWYAAYNPNVKSFYTVTGVNNRTIKMHNLIMNPKPSEEVDHIFQRTLDNRKSELRLCNRSKNAMNRRMLTINSSGFKGGCLIVKLIRNIKQEFK